MWGLTATRRMVRVINQQTFDDVVQENMEEFDMAVEEAIVEAVKQFEAQVQYRLLKLA